MKRFGNVQRRSLYLHSLLPAIVLVVADDSGNQPFAVVVIPEVHERRIALVGINSWMQEPVRPRNTMLILGAGILRPRKGRKDVGAKVVYSHRCMQEREQHSLNLRESALLKFGRVL